MLLHYTLQGVTKQIQVDEIGDLIDEFGHQNVLETIIDLFAQDDDDLFNILEHLVDEAWEEWVKWNQAGKSKGLLLRRSIVNECVLKTIVS